ncbi:MAG: hypothetical protein IIC78_06420 [Chloroflexi bacterium]|nr:hypothetical protein [Chloroflexota bacterium]
MNTGMLWFDDSSRSLTLKVEDAVDYYKNKYGQSPTVCFVNPATFAGEKIVQNGVEVRETMTVMPHHFWIGVDEKAKKGKGKSS